MGLVSSMANLTKKRWTILVASCLINLCIGSLYAWSVFATPMASHISSVTGEEIKSLAIVFTIANAVGPVTMISGGIINDKLGPKWIIFIGGILFGLGMFFSGFASSSTMLIVTYGLGVGFGVGMVYGCTISNSVKFFPDKPGLAGGLTTASYGISSVIVPIIANSLISRFSITMAFRILGISMLCIICGCTFIIRACPKDFLPDGWTPLNTREKETVKDKNWKQMLQDPVFYIMIIILCCGAFSGLMIVSQASLMAQNMLGMDALEAAAIVSLLALLNTMGRLLAGIISDKIGVINTITIIFLLLTFGLGLMYYSSINFVIIFYIGISIIGFCFGLIMGIYPAFTASQFGRLHNSVNYGIMFIGFAVAGYFGPTIMSDIYTSTNNYQMAFVIAIGLSVTGIVFSFIYRIIQNRDNKKLRDLN